MDNNTNQMTGLWIPIEILNDTSLNANEKLVLSIIKALDNGKGCFASNKYIAQLIGLKPRSMSAIISSLQEKGYVSVVIEEHYKRTITYIGLSTPVEDDNVINLEEKKKSHIYDGCNIDNIDNEGLQRMLSSKHVKDEVKIIIHEVLNSRMGLPHENITS